MKDKLYSVFFAFALTLVFTLILASINALATGTIEVNEKLDFQKSLLYVFGFVQKDDKLSSKEIQELYGEKIVELRGEVDVYRAQVEGETGYAFTVQSPGLWGTITGLIAINASGTRMLGIDFVEHSETPGLGGRIDEKAFQQQFRNEKISSGPSGRIAVVSGQDTSSSEDSKVDAITGATRTSEAIQKLIDKAMNEVFPKVLKVVN
ncbi:MAG TPA: FMN-binding protein [Mesotoga infera]|jgi:Na+-transporting NADH:ubiquinone oxidoreductase subunit C|uniref:FMN-binding domain protein n=1 Tax=Mesotoga infera TaxID=1236046 RepID=A0A7Z7LH32_9BACT|nr:FMN-binding protein [Mesotoga infera]MBP8659946.1 FMN-binding protein [Mesotoga sp.]NLI07484.1 FMN-binding protein [Thermotogaceae bacterium]SSC13770.1 FMN-binding domain protein [Mesotoga infera]HNR79581.1 FMN-binding protein [Mesotoga infera]HNS67808.1 FMN-binding protein [Mesotoga infera]